MPEFAPALTGRGEAGSVYEVLYTDFKTGQLLGAVPAMTLSASGELNRAERISVTIPLVFEPRINSSITTNTDTLHSLNNFEPSAVAVFIRRDGVMLWGGILWGVSNIDFSAEMMTLDCLGMLSYLDKRVIRNTLSFTSIDQDTIASDLIEDAISGVAIETTLNVHGVNRSRDYLGFDRHVVGSALVNLAELQNGFDFYFTHTLSNNVITSTLRTSYPANGRATNFTVEFDRCFTLSISKDGSNLVNFADAISNTYADIPIIEQATNAASTAARPQLDAVRFLTDTSERSELKESAERDLQRGATSAIRAMATLHPEVEPKVGSYLIGDRVRLRAKLGAVDFDRQMRIVGAGLSVDGDGREVQSLSMVNVELFDLSTVEEVEVPDI